MKKIVKAISLLCLVPFLFSCSQPNSGENNNGNGKNNVPSNGDTTEDGSVFSLMKNVSLDSEGYPVNEDEDTDGDGLTNAQEKTWGTNPFMVDTDGDGFSDYEEAMELYVKTTNAFNPCIADLPKIDMSLTSRPKIILSYTHSTETSKTNSTELSCETSQEFSTTNSYSYTTGLENSWNVGVEAGYEDGGFVGKVSVGYSGTASTEDSWSYEEGASVSYAESMAKSVEESESEGYEYDGGKLLFGVRFVNNSDVAYTVTSMTLDAYRVDNTNDDFIIPIGTLVPQGSDGAFTIAPKGSKDAIYVIEDLTLQEMEEIIQYSNSIVVRVSSYTFSFSKDGDETDFTGILTTSAAKNASVSIDYGPRVNLESGLQVEQKTESYKIATKTFVNSNAASVKDLYNKVGLQKILKSSYLQDAMKIENGYIKEIRGVKDTKVSSWYIYHTTVDTYTKSKITKVYKASETPISTIRIETQDSLDFIYSVDQDEDGIPLRVESMFGTSDKNKDSDGDGLSDYDEIMGKVPNADGTTTKTNPTIKDTDWDGYPDANDDYPAITAISEDARIKSITYRKRTENANTSSVLYSYNENETKDNYDLVLKNFDMDSIFVKINTEIPGSIIKYKFGDNVKAVRVNNDQEFEISGLQVGENIITFEVTATDSIHKCTYELKLNSVLEKPIIVSTNSDGSESNKKISIKYKVNDTRIKSVVFNKSNKTSIEIAKNPSLFSNNPDITFSTPTYGKDQEVQIAYDKYNTTYNFVPISIDADEHYSEGSKVSVTTGNSPKGYLTIGLHTLVCIYSDDGGADYDCEYYWTIKNNGASFSEFGSSNTKDLAGGHSNSHKDNPSTYYFKNDSTGDYSLSQIESNCITKTVNYSKKENHSHNLYVKLMEDDTSYDDTIYDGNITLSYNATTDKWTCGSTEITRGTTKWITTALNGDDNKVNLIWFVKWEDDNGQ